MTKSIMNRVIAVAGATASGKSAYAVELAKKIDGEIVSADSRLVYKGMDIGTAKPTKIEQGEIPHYMIDVVEPDFNYSAGVYAKEAKKCVDDILSRGKVPIVTGGTGLYYKVLLENYDLPKIEPDKKLREELSKLPFEKLYDILEKIDKEAVKSLELNDKKKVIRYIEIVKSTGKPLNESRGLRENAYEVEWIGLNFPRDVLYERINKRVDLMLEQGLVDETKNLLKRYGRISNIVDTIGYREIIQALDGLISFDEAVEKLKQNTRHYAKRQLTWFRRYPQIKWDYYPEKLKK